MIYISDLTTYEGYGLSKADKTFVYKSGRLARPTCRGYQRLQQADAPANLVDTETKQEKVGDYNAKIFTLGDSFNETSFWVTKDVPNYTVILAALKRLVLHGHGYDLMPVNWKIDGIPIKTKIISDGHHMFTRTLISLKQDPVDDALFQPPPDYKETAPVYTVKRCFTHGDSASARIQM